MILHGRYTIVRKVADGGTAEVFLARQHGVQGFEKLVVLKRIFTAFYADPLFRNMLVDEAHIAMGLSHGNIVQVLDLGEAGGRYFLALELIDGWPLDSILHRAQKASFPMPQDLALWIAAAVCRALAYAHTKTVDGRALGIVHRDVSPHNVLISTDGEVKLTDFGIAKAHVKKDHSAGNVVKGKIAFMSPEQAEGHDVDARSDLFSLGTCLYEMVTGKRPFEGATDYETLLLVRECKVPAPQVARAGVNPWVARTIRQAMTKDPGLRYQKAELMLADLERTLRTSFRPVGQTELKTWLRDLGERDHVPSLTQVKVPTGERIEPETVVLGEGDRQDRPYAVARPPTPPTGVLFPSEGPTVPDDAVVAAPLIMAESTRMPPPLPPLPPRTRAWQRSWRVMAGAAAGTVLLGAVALALTRGGGKPKSPPLPLPAPAAVPAPLRAPAATAAPAAMTAPAAPAAPAAPTPTGAAPPPPAAKLGAAAAAPGVPAAAGAAVGGTAMPGSGETPDQKAQHRSHRHHGKAGRAGGSSTDRSRSETRPADKKSADKKPADKKPADKKPADKKKGRFFLPVD